MIYRTILLAVLLLFPQGAIGLLQKLFGLFAARKPAPAPTTATALAPLTQGAKLATGPDIVLDLAGLTKRYKGVTALSDVTMQVRRGTVHAIIGPNGAGKSTLINVVSGLYAADDGKIAFAGKDVTRAPAHRRSRLGLARTFQNLQLVRSLTVLENVMLGIQPRRSAPLDFLAWLSSTEFDSEERARALALLDRFSIAHVAASYPDDLPYGHRKLAELARAVAEDPVLMLLDEPIAGLNDREALEIARVIRAIRDTGTTIVLVEHNMEFVMGLSDRITVLDYGQKIAEGTPQEVQADPRVIEAYLGVTPSEVGTKSEAASA